MYLQIFYIPNSILNSSIIICQSFDTTILIFTYFSSFRIAIIIIVFLIPHIMSLFLISNSMSLFLIPHNMSHILVYWNHWRGDWLSWVTDVTTLQGDWHDFFLSCPRYFFPHLFSSSYVLPLFHCLISILLFPCTGVWENTRAWVPHFL